MAAFNDSHGFTVAIGGHPLPSASIPGAVTPYENPGVGVDLDVPCAIGMPDGSGRPCCGTAPLHTDRAATKIDRQVMRHGPARHVGMQPVDLA